MVVNTYGGKQHPNRLEDGVEQRVNYGGPDPLDEEEQQVENSQQRSDGPDVAEGDAGKVDAPAESAGQGAEGCQQPVKPEFGAAE